MELVFTVLDRVRALSSAHESLIVLFILMWVLVKRRRWTSGAMVYGVETNSLGHLTR